MAVGFLRIQVSTANGNLPVANARIRIADSNGEVLYNQQSDSAGNAQAVELYAPSAEGTLDPMYTGERYAKYDVAVSADGYVAANIVGVQIYAGQGSYLPVQLEPQASGATRSINQIIIGPNALENPQPNTGEHPPEEAAMERVLRDVIIPTYIRVHLGRPAAAAQNVRVPFIDYINN